MAGEQHHDARDDERDQRGEQRHHDAAAAQVGREPGLGAGSGEVVLAADGGALRTLCRHDVTVVAPRARPPVIAMPSSSSVASGANSPAILPS